MRAADGRLIDAGIVRGKTVVARFVYRRAGFIHGRASFVYRRAAGFIYGRAGLVYGRAGFIYGRAGLVYGRAGLVYGRAGFIYGRAVRRVHRRGGHRVGGAAGRVAFFTVGCRWPIELGTRSRCTGSNRMALVGVAVLFIQSAVQLTVDETSYSPA
jgi:hypothetical protein